MAKIELGSMAFYAHHGCFEEEQIIGNHFTVDVVFEYDSGHAEHTDNLKSAIDYQEVYAIVKSEMNIKSKLLEHIARRIVDTIKYKYSDIKNISVKISKHNPPIGGKMERVSVTINS